MRFIQIELRHFPDEQAVSHFLMAVPAQPIFALGVPDEVPDVVASGKIDDLFAVLNFGHDIHLSLPAIRTRYRQAHSRLRPQSVVVVLNFPDVASGGHEAIYFADLISGLESLRLGVTTGLDGHHEALVTDHLHLPPVLHARAMLWRDEEGMRILKIH